MAESHVLGAHPVKNRILSNQPFQCFGLKVNVFAALFMISIVPARKCVVELEVHNLVPESFAQIRMELGAKEPLRSLDTCEVLDLLLLANLAMRRNVSERVPNRLVHEHTLVKEIKLQLILRCTPLAVRNDGTDRCENGHSEGC